MKKHVWFITYFLGSLIPLYGMHGQKAQRQRDKAYFAEQERRQAYIKEQQIVKAAQQERLRENICVVPFEYILNNDCKKSILICSLRSHDSSDNDQASQRAVSVRSLYKFSIEGMQEKYKKIVEKFGRDTKIVIFPNKVEGYENNPSSKRAIVLFCQNGSPRWKECEDGERDVKDSSLVIYNMSIYFSDVRFDEAYTDKLHDALLYKMDTPCIVNIDVNLRKKWDAVSKIYNRFYGKKRIMLLNPFGGMDEYYPWTQKLGTPCIMLGVVMIVLCCGYWQILSEQMQLIVACGL